MSRRRDPRLRDRGTATVEFAIVVPVLLLLVFGIIDFGRMASDHVQLTAAARAAAMAAAAHANPTTAATSVLAGVSVTVNNACPTAPRPGRVVQVTVTYTFRFATPFAALASHRSSNPTMTAQAAAPCRG